MPRRVTVIPHRGCSEKLRTTMLEGMEEEFVRTVIVLFAVIGFLVTIYGVSTRVIEPAWKELKRRNPRLALRIVPHFARVLGVVSPHAVDASDRKDPVALDDRQSRGRRKINGVIHRFLL